MFIVVRESRFPRRARSPFRETALLVLVSAVADGAALALFGIFRACFPHITPDVEQIVTRPQAFINAYYLSASCWAAGLAAFACGLAVLAARVLPELPGENTAWNAWNLAFWKDPRAQTNEIYVGCELTDGSYIAGYLRRHSTEPDETENRDLTLEAPITYIVDGEQAELPVNNTIVSAKQIKFITVSYVPSPWAGAVRRSGT